MKPSKLSHNINPVPWPLRQSLSNTSGAVLLTVVVIIIIIGLAGVAIYSLTYTSTFAQLHAQNATKAYYLAESGARVVAAEYNNASDKNDVLENQLHGKTLTLPDPAGQFDVRVYPYWFYVAADYTENSDSIDIKMPGGIPLQNPENPASPRISIPSSGQVKLQGKTLLATFTTTDTSPSDGDTITLNLPDADKRFPYNIDAGEDIFLVYKDINTTSQIDVDVGNSIDLYGGNDVAQMLPAENGSFRIYNETNAKMDYSYKERIIGPGSPPAFVRLTGIDNQSNDNESEFPFSIDSDTEIYLGKNLAVFSTSSFGQGDMAAKKTVGNYTDVGLDGGFSSGKDTISFEDDIEDFSPKMAQGGDEKTSGDENSPIVVYTEPGNERVELGRNLQDSYGSVWYKGDSDIANCIDGKCNLGKGIRAYFEFQIDCDDDNDNLVYGPDGDEESKGCGDGFTFAIISGIDEGLGNYRNTADDTGSGGEYLGYAGPGLDEGLKPPKIGIEIDTFPSTGAGNICVNDGNRRDDDPAANHAALVYWGAETIGAFDAISTSNLKSNGGGYLRIGDPNPDNGDSEDWSSLQGTISFWFKRDDIRSTDRLWGQHNSMEILLREPGHTLRLDWGDEYGNWTIADHPFQIDGIWYFIAITWDETSNVMQVYYGDEDTDPYIYDTKDDWTDSLADVGITENLFMNSSGGNLDQNYIVDGSAADLRYYNVTRSLAQIQSDYQLGLTGSEPGLQAYFPLQVETGLLDAGPLGITATALGTTDWSTDSFIAFDCGPGAASYDDNRHGAGGAVSPMNSLNIPLSGGDDGYFTKASLDPTWLEDGNLHRLRMELIRPVLSPADDGDDDAFYDYQVKIWIDCNGVGCTTDEEKNQFRDVRRTYSVHDAQIEMTVDNTNSLKLDQAIHDEAKRILFGFTQGTGSNTQNITLSDFELYFLKRYPSDLDEW